MARGRSILVTGNPRGYFEECVIDGTPLPGYLMEITPNSAFQSGRPHMRACTKTAGALAAAIVLLDDSCQGFLGIGTTGAGSSSGGVSIPGLPGTGTAYVAGTHGFVYWALPGDDLNLVVGDVAGTGDVITQGDLFAFNNNGTIIRDSTNTNAPFQAMETLTALTAATPVWVKYLGTSAG